MKNIYSNLFLQQSNRRINRDPYTFKPIWRQSSNILRLFNNMTPSSPPPTLLLLGSRDHDNSFLWYSFT